MLKVVENTIPTEEESGAMTLDELAREGARRMLMQALEAEVASYIEQHRRARDDAGRALVVRNGKAKEHSVTLGAGTVQVQAPRVNDKRVSEAGERQRFTSKILPPYMRRSPKVAEVLPVLYLRGLSTGDFKEALTLLLGEDAAGRPQRTSRVSRTSGTPSTRPSSDAGWMIATTSTSGRTGSTSTSGSRRTASVRS